MNNPYILSVYCCGATALKLRNYLREKSGKNVMYMRPGLKDYDYYTQFSPTVRWGNGEDLNFGRKDTEFNSYLVIHSTSHKIRMSQALDNAKIPCITFHKGTPEKYPVVVRQLICGQGGKGIIICEDYEHWKPYSSYWYSYFIPFAFNVAASTAFIIVALRCPFSNSWSPVIVVPPGEVTISFSSAGCFPVSKTILADPSAVCVANLRAISFGRPIFTAPSVKASRITKK